MSNAGRYLGPHIRTGANSYTLAPIPITAPRLTPISNLGRVSAGINDEYRRGTSLGSDKLNPLTPFIWDDFVNEHRYKKLIIDDDYSNIFDGLNDRTVKDIEKRRELSKQSQNHAAINAAQKDLEVTVKAIEEKAVEYDRLTKDAHSLYGLNPLFLMIDLPFRKIYEGVHQGVESFNKALSDIDAAYKAALEQKRISLESNTLASQLPLLALNIEQLAQSSPNDSDRVASWTSDSLSVINVEKNIRLSLLAYFLQDSIVNAAGALEGLTRSEALEKYLVALDSKVASEKSAIGS
ncbi:hypothetical protein [Pseudomonas antarctica]|uniref:hypothetical protein n=1 Tax=Pseudomonas antarctica TaxID=219572 RepID=UPI003F74EB91